MLLSIQTLIQTSKLVLMSSKDRKRSCFDCWSSINFSSKSRWKYLIKILFRLWRVLSHSELQLESDHQLEFPPQFKSKRKEKNCDQFRQQLLVLSKNRKLLLKLDKRLKTVDRHLVILMLNQRLIQESQKLKSIMMFEQAPHLKLKRRL